MTEKIPDFVKRVHDKFMPTTLKGSIWFDLLAVDDAEKLIAMGGKVIKRDEWDHPVVRFKSEELGEPLDWWPMYYDQYAKDHLKTSIFANEDDCKGYFACVTYDGEHLHPVQCYKNSGVQEKINSFLGLKEWQNCHDYYAKKYEVDKKKFESKNLIWKQLQELNSPKMKARLSENERESMQNLYEARLKKDPDYQSLQELKRGIVDLSTYIKWLKKEKQKDKRGGLRERLESLKKEYDSTEVKEALPDEKKRLSVRGIMHKKLKKEADM